MAEPAICVNEMTQRILAAHPPEHCVGLQFEECHIHARTNSRRVADRLRAYYLGFVVPARAPTVTVNLIEASPPHLDCTFTPQPRPPGKRQPKEEHSNLRDGRIVRKVRTGMVFMCGSRTHLAVGPCELNLNQVINFINQHHIAWGLDRRRLLLHAAGVCDEKNGLALAGASGTGKSTLALHLLSRGLDFVSNDRLMIAQDARALTMHGLAKMPRVNPGTMLHNSRLAQFLPEARRQQLRDLPEKELWDLEEKFEVPIRRVYGPDRFVLQSRLCGLVVLTWARTGAPPVVREDLLRQRRELLPAIMKSPGTVHRRADQPGRYAHVTQDYLKVLGDCPVLEIAGGVSFGGAAEHCIAFLQRHGIQDREPTLDEQHE
jgi:HprK-related kinase B